MSKKQRIADLERRVAQLESEITWLRLQQPVTYPWRDSWPYPWPQVIWTTEVTSGGTDQPHCPGQFIDPDKEKMADRLSKLRGWS
jgi:hypothetical protein